MGFYSSNCLDCGHPLLSDRATNEINAWMNLGVAITRDGSLLKGCYDGYGTTHVARWAHLPVRGRLQHHGVASGVLVGQRLTYRLLRGIALIRGSGLVLCRPCP